MKKKLRFFALLAVLMVPWAARADELTVCTNTTSDTTYKLPIYGAYCDYGHTTESVYPSRMLNALSGGTITSLTYYAATTHANVSWSGTSFRVYLEEVDDTVYSESNGPWKKTSAATLVYEGPLAVVNQTLEIPLDDPYTYDGGHLLVHIENNGGAQWAHAYFRKASTTHRSSAYRTEYGTPAWPTNATFSSSETDLPMCTFTYSSGDASVCRVPNDLRVSEISANNATFSWVARNEESEWIVYLNGEEYTSTSDTFYTFNTLNAMTVYTVGVRSVCGAGDTSRMATAMFQTPCAAITTLPYTCDFEAANTGSSPLPSCWTRGVTSASNHYVINNSGNAHNSNRFLYIYGNGIIAALPVFDTTEINLAETQLTFYGKNGGGSVDVQVGAMNNPLDNSTFHLLGTLTLTNSQAHEFYELPLLGYQEGMGAYIALRGTTTSNAYIDDITIEPVPACSRPIVGTSTVLADEATITWSSTGTNFAVYYKKSSDASYTELDNFESTGDNNYSATLEELTPSTNYTFYVVALCDDDATPRSVDASFTTSCAMFSAENDMPLYFDFEDMPAGASFSRPCWNRVSFASSYSTWPQSYSQTGPGGVGQRAVYFYTDANAYQYIVMPPIDDLSNLMVSFSMRYISSGVGITVGVMTDANDTATFTPVRSFLPSSTNSSTWDDCETVLSQYEGEGHFIAFRIIPPTGTSGGVMMDNIHVDIAPSCMRPEVISVSNVSAYSGQLHIVDVSEGGNYLVELVHGNDTTTFSTSDTMVSLTELVPSTSYTVHVYKICPDGDTTTRSTNAAFQTPCVAVPIPWEENFNSLPQSNEVRNLLCWGYYNASWSNVMSGNGMGDLSTSYKHIKYGSSEGMDGSNHIVLNIYSTGVYPWFVTPQIDLSSDAALSFDLALNKWGTTQAPAGDLSDDRFIVAVTTDGGTTWTPLAMWGSDSTRDNYVYGNISSTSENIVLPLTQFVGDTIRIGFYGESTVSGDDNSIRIDNITVSSMNCMPPARLTVTNVASEEATLAWIGSGSYEYRYAPAADTSNWVTGTTSDTTITLTNLNASTYYLFMIHTDCGADGVSRWTSTAFRTECGVISVLPWNETFQSYTAEAGAGEASSITNIPCWDVYQTNGNLSFVQSSWNHEEGGANAVRIYAGNNYPTYMVLPTFEEHLENLMFTFWSNFDNTTLHMVVGYMTDGSLTSSFVPLDTIWAATDSDRNLWTYNEVIFPAGA